MFKIKLDKRTFVSAFLAAFLVGNFLLSGTKNSVIAQQGPQVTICHRTSSNSNPYLQETVSVPSVDGVVPPASDHMHHTGPVWPATDADGKWGDIVPPVDNDGNPMPAGGLNWTSDGQAIWRNGCNAVVATATPTPCNGEFCNQSTPTPTATPTATPESTPDPDVCANIDGIQTGVPGGLHLDASGRNCVAFQLGGAPTPPPAGQVLGASTGQVLGASTLGGTGTAKENLSMGLIEVGAIVLLSSLYGFAKESYNSKE